MQRTILSTKTRDGLGYYAGPARILSLTSGVMFPNTPTVSVSHTANYEDYDLTHSNYAMWAYRNSKVDNITVTATFTCNTLFEADYFLGVQHFLRSVGKMHFGVNDPNAGAPPPVLHFTHLGPSAFDKVPVVLSNAMFSFEDNCNYVESSDGTIVPIINMISIVLLPYYTPSKLRSEFTLTGFKSGSLLRKGYI